MDVSGFAVLGKSPTKYRFITNPIRKFIFWAIRPYLAGLPNFASYATRSELDAVLRDARASVVAGLPDFHIFALRTEVVSAHAAAIEFGRTSFDGAMAAIRKVDGLFAIATEEGRNNTARLESCLGEAMQQLTSMDQKLTQSMSNLSNIQNLTRALQKDQEATAFRLGTIEQGAYAAALRLDALKHVAGGLQNLEMQIPQWQENLESLASRCSLLDESIQVATRRLEPIDGIAGHVADVTSFSQALQNNQQSIGMRLDSMESLVTSLVTRIDSVHGNVREQFRLVSDVRNAVSTLRGIGNLIDTPFSEIDAKVSYGQLGEDRILAYFFEAIGRGTQNLRYLDLGAAYPGGSSNTFLFYTLGGSGVLVEADPAYREAYAAVRPRDAVEQCAVVPRRMMSDSKVTFHRLSNKGWSTVSEEHLVKARALGKAEQIDSFEVDCLDINHLLKKHFTSGPFDLMSIDIEGLDSEVMAEMDLATFRPLAIVMENIYDVETHTFNPPVGGNLTDRGYVHFASTFANSIYVDREAFDKIKV